jgi:transcriptional regulator with XRE-family HTH domain
VFYDKYAQLCKKRGISMSAAAVEAGLSKSLVTKWKSNKVDVPSPDVLKKLSNYFGMPVSELLGEERTEEHIEMHKKNDALSDIIVELRTDKEFMSIVETIYKMDKEKRSSLLAFLK